MSVTAEAREEVTSRDELIADLLPLARRLAGRYRRSGESLEDLEQVAYLGLVKAVDRYDPDAGPLVRYAVPTILGELRRHFRDKGWGTHVSRPVQENLLKATAASDQLATRLGRTPTVADISSETGIPFGEVIEALEAARSYKPTSLDAPIGNGTPDPGFLRDTLGSTDHHYDYVEIGATIAPAFRRLPSREQQIVQMRFFEDLTQSEIATRMGISQMHVSRLLRRALDHLHAAMTSVAA